MPTEAEPPPCLRIDFLIGAYFQLESSFVLKQPFYLIVIKQCRVQSDSWKTSLLFPALLSVESHLFFFSSFFSSSFFFFSELETEPRALRLLGKCSTAELNPQPRKSSLSLAIVAILKHPAFNLAAQRSLSIVDAVSTLAVIPSFLFLFLICFKQSFMYPIS